MKYVLTYGIAYVAEESDEDLLLEISNITTNKDVADKIVKACNTYQLSPVHLWDVVDDFVNM